MKAIYPGSFDPIHKGHLSIINQVKDMFEEVVIAIGINPLKKSSPIDYRIKCIQKELDNNKLKNITVDIYNGLLIDYVNKIKPDCIIKGLRNSQDFEYEKTQQYWNEDLGITIPTLYIISDRCLVHISSSAIRMIENIKGFNPEAK